MKSWLRKQDFADWCVLVNFSLLPLTLVLIHKGYPATITWSLTGMQFASAGMQFAYVHGWRKGSDAILNTLKRP